jgi:hypothetical protein
MPDLSTFFSKGSVDIPRAKIEGFSGLNELAEELKIKELYNPTMVNFDPSYLIDNGRLTLNQTDFKLAGYDAQTSGSIGFDKSLVLSAVLNIPTTELGTLLNQDLSMLEGQTTKVPAEIGGTVKNPKVNIALDQVAANVAGQLKQAGVQAAEEKKAEMEQKAKEELDKKKEEAKDEIKDKIKGLFGK